MASHHHVGERLSYEGSLCTVRYIGAVAGTTGKWLGVEWDNPARGKHDGSHKGKRYFNCLSKSPSAASFIRITRPSDWPVRSFVAALQEKYAPNVEHESSSATGSSTGTGTAAAPIVISGKVAEEVGFDKIRRRLARLEDLRIVILDGMRIACAVNHDDPGIRETCPSIVELDLSRNLLEQFGEVVDVCAQLEHVKSLKVNGNRFLGLLEDKRLKNSEAAFRSVKELALEECLITWAEACEIAAKFTSLSSLNVGTNQLSELNGSVGFGSLASTLTTLNLEYNEFTTLAQLAPLTSLAALRQLHLKGNNIVSISDEDANVPIPVFPSSLQYLDLSYNQVASWSFADRLTDVFPGLVALRFGHNPIYDNPEPESGTATTIKASGQGQSAPTDESYMITVARVAPLKTLNFVTVSPADRANAEMFYLSRIARQLAAVPESAESGVLAKHPRYADLCGLYGEPDVVRRQEATNPNFLEARLVTVQFSHGELGPEAGNETLEKGYQPGMKMRRKTTRIPKSFDVYAVKGIAGRLFGLPPLGLRLVWETGEWDPVAGFDDEVGDSSEEEGNEAGAEAREAQEGERRAGRWVKREVELRDGPRQLGFCVDGLEAKIRVEMKT